jgi:ubiquinone/menaquinone biosynthesis C-methylase UbiE
LLGICAELKVSKKFSPFRPHSNNVPYPFKDSSYDEICVVNYLEHLDDVMGTMERLYRICKAGGLLNVIVLFLGLPWLSVTQPIGAIFFSIILVF